MNYNEIQLLIQYKRTTRLLKIAKELKKSMESMTLLNNDEYNILNTIREIIKIQAIKVVKYENEVNQKKLLEKITIDDLISIECYDK